jgi:hypothetical protein
MKFIEDCEIGDLILLGNRGSEEPIFIPGFYFVVDMADNARGIRNELYVLDRNCRNTQSDIPNKVSINSCVATVKKV